MAVLSKFKFKFDQKGVLLVHRRKTKGQVTANITQMLSDDQNPKKSCRTAPFPQNNTLNLPIHEFGEENFNKSMGAENFGLKRCRQSISLNGRTSTQKNRNEVFLDQVINQMLKEKEPDFKPKK